MNIYLTGGTFEFLKRLEDKYPNEVMVTMVNGNGALLLHETMAETVFKQPRKYKVVESTGEFNKKEGFAVLNNISVTDEGRPLLEYQVKLSTQKIKSEPGLISFRLLRPLSSNTYVILTVWEKETDYLKWQSSGSSFDANVSQLASLNKQSKIFASEPYTSKYSITK